MHEESFNKLYTGVDCLQLALKASMQRWYLQKARVFFFVDLKVPCLTKTCIFSKILNGIVG